MWQSPIAFVQITLCSARLFEATTTDMFCILLKNFRKSQETTDQAMIMQGLQVFISTH